MNNFALCLSAILPILLIAAAGYGAKRIGLIREADVPRANKWAFGAFMPLMCFYNIYSSDLSSALRPKLIIFTVLAIFIVFGLSFLYARRFIPERESRGVVIQGLFRSNYVILGLPMAAGLLPGGDIGVAAVMSAIVVPIFNVLAVITLEAYKGEKPDLRRLLLDILKNPLLKPIQDLAKAASPLMLFLLGAFFRFGSERTRIRQTAAVCAGRLVIVPALVLGAAAALGFRGIEIITLLAIFASPTAVASFTMAEQLGGDAPLAGNIVVWSSFLSAFTLFAWSLLLKMLNFF